MCRSCTQALFERFGYVCLIPPALPLSQCTSTTGSEVHTRKVSKHLPSCHSRSNVTCTSSRATSTALWVVLYLVHTSSSAAVVLCPLVTTSTCSAHDHVPFCTAYTQDNN